MIHALTNMVLSCASIATFIYGLGREGQPAYIWASGLGSYFLFPIVIEILLNIKAAIRRGSLNNHKCTHHLNNFPIVYSSGYNITACGLERMHPFDSTKYGKIRIYRYLKEKGVLNKERKLHSP